jgi:magnesium transporter
MLVNCVAYQDGSKLADITVDEISDYVARPGYFVWVALKDASDDELTEMQKEFLLHDLAIEDARHGHQRPKIEEYADTLFAVLHTVETMEDGALSVGEVDVFVGPNFVLSVRNRTQTGFLGVRRRAEREPHLLRHGPAFVSTRCWTRSSTAISRSSTRSRPTSKRSRTRSSSRASAERTSSAPMR